MEQTKESLRNDYNNAVDYFNEKKYDRFLRNIRTAICLLSKYIIFDIAYNEDEAHAVINGSNSLQWNKNANCYDLQDYPANHEPSGREFPILMYRYFICKHKDYCTNYAERNKKEIKAVMNGYGEGLAGLYSITSEWNHSEKTPNLSAHSQAICTASYIESFIDYLSKKKILSESTIATLLSFTKFDFSNTKELESHEERIEDLNGKIRDLEVTLNERNVIIAEKNGRIKDLESKNQSSTETEERINSLTQDLERSKSKYADDLASYQKHLADKETEISDLKRELEKYKQACVESNQKAEEERNIRLELETTIAQMQADQDSKEAAEEEVSLDNLFDIPEEAEETDDESNQSIFDLFSEEDDEEESDDDTIEAEDIKDPALRRVLNWVNQGMTATQIRDASKAKPQNTYRRIAILVEKGYADAKQFISTDIYDEIYEAINEVGTSADKQEIKEECTSRVALWQISIVLAELKYKEITIEPNKWEFVTGISYKPVKASKWLFKTTHKCRVVRSSKGYYLQVGNEFIKLGNYPVGTNPDEGSIWLMGINPIGKEIVHETGNHKHLVGYIRDEKKRIVFTTPDKDEKYITFG